VQRDAGLKVDKKKNSRKKWRAKEEERHKE
jgi:hypothetical protein